MNRPVEQHEPCMALLDAAKNIKPPMFTIDREQRAAWYRLQAEIGKLDKLYDGGGS